MGAWGRELETARFPDLVELFPLRDRVDSVMVFASEDGLTVVHILSHIIENLAKGIRRNVAWCRPLQWPWPWVCGAT
jgi:hypothetical protein